MIVYLYCSTVTMIPGMHERLIRGEHDRVFCSLKNVLLSNSFDRSRSECRRRFR